MGRTGIPLEAEQTTPGVDQLKDSAQKLEKRIQILERIVELDPNSREGQAKTEIEEAKARLENIRKQIAAAEHQRVREEAQKQEELALLYTQATDLLHAGRRAEAIPILEQILQIDPNYRDAAELLSQAQHPTFTACVADLWKTARSRFKDVPRRTRQVGGLIAAIVAVGLCVIVAALLLVTRDSTPTPTTVALTTPSADPGQMPTGTQPALTTIPSVALATSTTAVDVSPSHAPTGEPTIVMPTNTSVPAPQIDTPVPPPTDTSAPPPTNTSIPPSPTDTFTPPSVATTRSFTPTPSLTTLPSAGPLPSGKIAFPIYDPARKTYDAYTLRTDGTARRRVASEASQPELSPDGTKIAFRSWNASTRGITVMNLDGTDRFDATNSLEDARPSWATNESLVLFSRKEEDRRGRLYLDGAWRDRSTDEIKHGSAPAFGETPSWLGESQIVYNLCNPQCGIYVTNPGGSGPRRLLEDKGKTGKTVPEGSPNAQRIAFMSERDGNWEIYVMNADGTGLRRLTNDPAIDGLPTWSPDGSYIAFVSTRTGQQNWSIWIVRPDGTELRKLFDLDGTIDGVVDEEPRWSSTGWMEEQISWSH